MSYSSAHRVGATALALLFLPAMYGQTLPNLYPLPNSAGLSETYTANGKQIRLDGPFFQSLGTNGRSCNSCHRAAQGWSVSPDELKVRFLLTAGKDPIFRTNDGSVCDHDIDTSTVQGRRAAYRLLTSKGLFRISLDVPSNAEFNVLSVSNPYGCNETGTVSVYRRALPSTNLRFLSAVMWDGRESSPQTGTQKITYATNPTDLEADLAHQALDATMGHAQGMAITPAQQKEIADFESQLITAQAYDWNAGKLNANGAKGGAAVLGTETVSNFFVGINDPLGGNPRGLPFTPTIFNLFDSWANNNHDDNDPDRWNQESRKRARAAIARGQEVFNSKPIDIRGVAGLNDDLGLTSIPGTCGTCHNSSNVGNHSFSVPLNIGLADKTGPLDVSYLPVIVVQNKTTGEIIETTDPGRALITGQWKDIGKMKGPILRGLASRPPYFHNGSAQTLSDVVRFYDERFNIGFTEQERADLIAFLNAL